MVSFWMAKPDPGLKTTSESERRFPAQFQHWNSEEFGPTKPQTDPPPTLVEALNWVIQTAECYISLHVCTSLFIDSVSWYKCAADVLTTCLKQKQICSFTSYPVTTPQLEDVSEFQCTPEYRYFWVLRYTWVWCINSCGPWARVARAPSENWWDTSGASPGDPGNLLWCSWVPKCFCS